MRSHLHAAQSSGASHLNDLEPLRSAKSSFWDRVLLVGAALILVVISVAAFIFADIFHVNPAWVFLAGNSVAMIPLFVRNFRGQVKRPSFLAFLAGWAIVHGFLMLALMTWVPLLYWIPVLGLEMFAGYIAARLLFGVVASAKI